MQRYSAICKVGLVATAVGIALAHAGQPDLGLIPVVVGTAVERQVATEVAVVGTVGPQLSTTLSSEIAGLTEFFDLRVGDFVQQGKTLVARLKSNDLQFTLDEAEAELARAKAELTRLKSGLRPEEIGARRAEVAERKAWAEKYAKDLGRARSLRERDMISASEYHLAESTYLAAKAQHEQASKTLRVAELGFRPEEIAAAEADVLRSQARVQRLRDDVQKTLIHSPVSGFLIRRYTEVGQWVERGGAVAGIIDLSTVLVHVPIHEREIRHVKMGDAATVTLDALPDRTFAGRIKHITPQADVSSRTFPVEIEVDNTPDTAIKAGMFARVTLRTGLEKLSVFVPKDAVVRRDTGHMAFVLEGRKVRMVPIRPGRVHEGLMEVAEGSLKPGDMVVITGNETLQDQMAVVVRPTARP
jgi:HlyD family secretion protein